MVVYSDGQSNSTKKMYRRSPRFLPIRSCHESTRCDPSLPPRLIPEQGQTNPDTGETKEEWVISIKKKMDRAVIDHDITSWDDLCIYKVPRYLQENDKKSYFPQTVSLGPYHHGQKHLEAMEPHKWRAVNMVITRTELCIEMYIDAMKELDEKARACYQGPIDMSSNKFTEMLVLDGCFVLELFRGTVEGFVEIGYKANDPVFGMRGLMHSIQRDMVMLENQLPLFVLDRLLDLGLQFNTQNNTGNVAELAVRFFKPLMPTSEMHCLDVSHRDKGEMHCLDVSHSDNGEMHCLDVSHSDNVERHCLDVFHRSLFRNFPSTPTSNRKPRRFLSSQNMSMVDKRQQQLIHCVTELREGGVKFRRKETDQFWDIEFKRGYLEIPKLLIHDGTKSMFSNLIAFEQCHIQSSDNITSYLIFMDNLINSSNDVSYLHHCGIIEHWLGSDSEVADLFNRLCKEVVFDPKDSYLSQMSGEVNRYYSRRWNSLKATLRHKYFNNPWAYISFFAAVILLILTFSQSFYAVYAYYKPSS